MAKSKAGKGPSGLASGMKIKPGPSGKMYGAKKVVPQKSGVSATTVSMSKKSYAK